jgi:hypothetical protein
MEINRVYEKLNKVELKAEKIELGLVDDLKKIYNKAVSVQKNANKKATTIRAEKSSLQGDIAEIFDSINLLDKDIEKAKSISKELGINTPKEVIVYEKFIKDLEQKNNKYIKDFNL